MEGSLERTGDEEPATPGVRLEDQLSKARVSVSEFVYEFVRESLLSGKLRPGQALKQDELATRLQVSRSPVREALSQLEREGLITFRPRHGYVVASLDTDEIHEIFQLRIMLEEYAARIATQCRTLHDIALAREALDGIDRLDIRDPEVAEKFGPLNRAFHAAIYQASRQRRLIQIASNLRDSVEQCIRLEAHYRTKERIAQAQREHRGILNAFIDGNAELAANLSREHCQNTYDAIMEALNKSDELSPVPGVSGSR